MTTGIESLLRTELGLVPHPSWAGSLAALEREMAERLRVDVTELPEALRQHPQLLRECAGRLTIGETFFFRHSAQLEALASQLVARLGRTPQRTLRVVSAGCSTGEELYSLAIAVVRRAGLRALCRLQLVGIDVSPDAVEGARAATYPAWSFRGAPRWLQETFFSVEKVEGAPPRFLLHRDLASAVTFSCEDICSHVSALATGGLDVLLFRNVAIYLADDAVHRIFTEAHRALCPEHGVLAVAPTDRSPPEHLFRRGDPAGLFHRGASISVSNRPTAPSRAPLRAPPHTAERRAPTARGPAPRASRGDELQRARVAADEGRYAEALGLVDGLIARHPGAAELHVLRGQVRLACDDVDGAAADLRRALYLDGGDVVARYWYAVALSVTRRSEAARKQARLVRRQLEETAGTKHDEEARELLDAVRFLEESLA